MVFLGEKDFLSANLIEKKYLSMKWAEKNILLALCALKNIVFVDKNNGATPNKTIVKLNGCSITILYLSSKLTYMSASFI